MLGTLRSVSIAAATALAALTATVTASSAETLLANLGPVGPNEPILADVGTSRLVAYYQPIDGKCAVNAVMFTTASNGGGHESNRVRLDLHPGELFHFDSANDERVILTCGPDAKGLTVLNRGEILTKSSRVLY